MIDCKKTENYLSERGRMCKRTKCSECPLGPNLNGTNKFCPAFEECYASKAIDIIQKWSNEHPQKTLLTEFLKHYPDVEMSSDGFPDYILPCILGLVEKKDICKNRCFYFYFYDKDKGCRPCYDCWNTLVEESEE